MNTIFFIASKTGRFLVQPENWAVLLLGLGLVALWRGRLGGAKRFLATGLGLLLLLGFLPLGQLLQRPLEARFAPNPQPAAVDGIVILGGAASGGLSRVWDQVQINASAERLTAGLQLARAYPAARIYYTGGSGRLLNQRDKGATVAARFYAEQGLPAGRITYEYNSRNTHENAVLTRKMANPAPGETWLLVTSAAHMPRAIGTFCQAGWPMVPYPVDYRTPPPGNPYPLVWNLADNIGGLNGAIHEWLGLWVYWLTGRSAAVFPTGC